jgi:phospholipid/cholesterol/gamma-HCH transport system permease protein
MNTGYALIAGLGDLALFSGRTFGWMVRRLPSRGTLVASCYSVGVRSVPVVAITGAFIGMVLAVQSYEQFRPYGLTTRLGAIINVGVLRELGPVLAATMIAGRIGSAMAAELGTMAVTDQIDAMTCLGVPAVHYLVVPRFLACVFLIPLLTVLADCAGVLGGALISIHLYQVDAHFYWANTEGLVHPWDLATGLIKSLFFGAAIGLISCQRGFHCRAGAEGVGRAATEAFVLSFMAILVFDFFLSLLLSGVARLAWQ